MIEISKHAVFAAALDLLKSQPHPAYAANDGEIQRAVETAHKVKLAVDALPEWSNAAAAPELEERGEKRTNEALKCACDWLAGELRDGQWHPVKFLKDDAHDCMAVTYSMLVRAKEELGKVCRIEQKKDGQTWFWRLGPLQIAEPDSPAAVQSDLINVSEVEPL
jgi:hypothetical protein